MSANQTTDEGFSRIEEIVGQTNVLMSLKSNICSFTNTDTGGMKRHIRSQHKPGKRSHEDDSKEDAEDGKRPKIDDDFEPPAASTQIMEEDDFDGLDEFEAALMAEENDFDGNGTTFAYSDEMLAKVGDATNFEIGNLVENETATEELINTVQQADNVILNARIKVIERESKEKDLKVEEMLSEINI